MSTPSKKAAPAYWGMAGVFPGTLKLANGEEIWRGDYWSGCRRVVAEHGFSGGSVGVEDLVKDERRAVLRELAEKFGQVQAVHLGINYREPVDATRKRLGEALDTILKHRGEVPVAFIPVVVTGPDAHRFDRAVSLERQLETVGAVLAPFVARCREAGLSVAIENHGDYYVSDLVGLCRRTPGLEIMLDTGNCFLIGERPDLIPDEAFPLVRATHWKDHFVKPNPKTLHFELTGATLGGGHAGLERVYERLIALHPEPEKIFMMIEWVPDPTRDVDECLTDSKRHLAKISGGGFPPARTRRS